MLERLVALKRKFVAHEQLQHADSDDLTRQTVSVHQSITHEQCFKLQKNSFKCAFQGA